MRNADIILPGEQELLDLTGMETEKDAVKILPLLKKNPHFKREIWVVPVDAVLSQACYETLKSQLEQLGIKFNQGSFE